MGEEKPYHLVAHQHESKEETVVRDAAAADVVEAGTQDAPMQVNCADRQDLDDYDATAADVVKSGTQQEASMLEEVVVAEEDGADRQDVDAAANDEAIAHALHMEELMQMEDWELRGFEEPHPADLLAGAEEPAVHAAQEEQAVHQFAATPGVFRGAAAQANTNNLLAAQTSANNQLAALADGADRPFVQQWLERGTRQRSFPHTSRGGAGPFNLETARHGRPVGNSEAITIRLETRNNAQAMARRTGPSKVDVISARQAVLADTSSPVVLAGMEEEAHDNAWYESIVLDAQRMEQIEDPELYEISFQQQLPRSEGPREESYHHSPTNMAGGEEDCREFSLQNSTKRWGLDQSELDPDKPGPSTERRTRVPPLAEDEVPKFDCGICLETLPVFDLFHGMQCEHRFCVECMATYIEGRIHAGEVPIPCPNPACKDVEDNGVLHPEQCKKSIDFAAFSNWGDRLSERAIPPNRRAYCPNRQCGVMLETTGGKTPAMAFCPVCGHPMCATCGLDWSADDSDRHDCTEGPDAELVKKLAAKRRWKQCPKCKMLVERTYGCDVMRCWCLFVFCYKCGRPMGRALEEEGEVCQCHNHLHLAAAHPDWFAHQ